MKDFEEILGQFRAGHHEFQNGHLEGFSGSDAFDLFRLWTQEAVDNGEREPNAFVLSTVNASGQPSSRILYLKDIINDNLVFYTNYESHKGEDIAGNNHISMLFFWPETSRQIRVQGRCVKAPEEVSDAYFASRPRGSQIGAWASNQSRLLGSREELEERVKEFDAKFEGEVPRPPHWGGYFVQPDKFEFWQGRPSRLHDRIVFSRNGESWELDRLNP